MTKRRNRRHSDDRNAVAAASSLFRQPSMQPAAKPASLPPAVDLCSLDWGVWGEARLSDEDLARIPEMFRHEQIFKNNLFQVNIRRLFVEDLGDMLHLSIKRIDREAFHDWRVFQRIKNELVGPSFEAVEIYPPESYLVDSANQYHLWVLPEGVLLPFGFRDPRMVCDESGQEGSKQRPFPAGQRPSDCMTGAELDARIQTALKALKQK